MAVDIIGRGYSTEEAKKYAIQYGSIGLKTVETNPTNDGILFTLVDDTTFDVPFTSLDFLLKSQLSSSTSSTATDVGANSNAIKLTNDRFTDYIPTVKITDSLLSTDNSYVAGANGLKILNDGKINKTDIQTTIINNPSAPASASTLFEVNSDLTNNYITNTKKSNSTTSESTNDVATSKAVFDAIDYLEGNLLAKADLTSDYNGTSITLGLSQKGGNNIKNLIVTAVSGLNYIGSIHGTNFKEMTV